MEPTTKLKQAIKDYKSGNSQAFDVLYNESSKYIYTCIYKVMCGNDNVHDATQEIMQDTYLEIYKSISQLENEDRFLQWAGMIATRKCYAYIKKNKKYVLVDEEDNTFDTLEDNDNIIPESIIQDKEKQRLIREIVEKELTEMQKLCVIAFYYNGQKQSEIAQELGIPENTVKTNLSRARVRIEKGILGVEKRDGIRLHSVAPFLLLLFTEDVQAAEVPQEITKNVLESVSGLVGTTGGTTAGAATATGVKGAVGKAAAISLKAKVIGGLVGLGALGAIGGAIYMANKSDEVPTWESEYKEYLLDYDDATGFDLNDFDGDGIPELLVKTENENIMVYRFDDEIKEVYELVSYAEENTNGLSETMECNYGYGMDYDEIVELDNWTGEYAGETYQMQTAILYEYVGGELEQAYSAAPALTGNADDIQVGYYITEDGQSSIVSKEDGMEAVNKYQNDFNEIFYTIVESEEMDIRFEEFKNKGNRQRKQQNSESEESEEVIEVELSEEEMETLRILAQFFTATRWGEDLAGEEIVPTEQNVCDFIGMVANENFEYNQWAYDKYLPTRIAEEEFRQVYTADSIKEYAKAVFGVEVSEINSYTLTEENGNYVAMEAQFSSGDKCVITKVTANGDIYTVMGTDAFGEYQDIYSSEPTYILSHNFTMTLTKNENSPFGYTLNSIKYEQGEDIAAEETNGLKEILLYPEKYSDYYSAISDYQNLFFALVDIDGDGVDEVMLGKAESVHPNFGPEALKIINILKYDAESNMVTDFDGDKVYEPLAVSDSFKLYDTGILMTRADMNYAYTNFWNLITGEFNEGWLWYPDDVMAGVNSEGHSKVKKQDGTEVTGEEGDKLYEALTSGEELPLEWHEATIENLNLFLK